MPEDTLCGRDSQKLASILRSEFEHFEADVTHAPELSSGIHRSIGIDNRQKSEYDLSRLRSLLSSSTDTPLVQVVGDSGTPFNEDKIPEVQAVFSSYVAGCMIEYGFTAARHDTNWLVAEYRASHPETALIANVVQQSIEALEQGCDGCSEASRFLLLFDRLSPTRFSDDVWLSDGIMDRKFGDKMICLEGGPQALYQCTNALAKGIHVIAVTNLRSARFSAARVISAFRNGSQCAEEYLAGVSLTSKQSNVARWCVSVLQQCEHDIASLIVPIDISQGSYSRG